MCQQRSDGENQREQQRLADHAQSLKRQEITDQSNQATQGCTQTQKASIAEHKLRQLTLQAPPIQQQHHQSDRQIGIEKDVAKADWIHCSCRSKQGSGTSFLQPLQDTGIQPRNST